MISKWSFRTVLTLKVKLQVLTMIHMWTNTLCSCKCIFASLLFRRPSQNMIFSVMFYWCFHRPTLLDSSNDKSNFLLTNTHTHTHTHTHIIHVNKKIIAAIERSQEVHSIFTAVSFLCSVFRSQWIRNMCFFSFKGSGFTVEGLKCHTSQSAFWRWFTSLSSMTWLVQNPLWCCSEILCSSL